MSTFFCSVLFLVLCNYYYYYYYYYYYTVSQKNWATFIFTVTLSNVGRF